MAMQHTATRHKDVRARPDSDCDQEWPGLSWRVELMNRVQDAGVDLGWRLKNIGLNAIGLWLVENCRRENGITI